MLVIKLDSSKFSHSIILESFSLEDNKKAPVKGSQKLTYILRGWPTEAKTLDFSLFKNCTKL